MSGHCRLSLGGHAHGDGRTLQEAANDLVARVLDVALAFHASGLRAAPDVPALDLEWLDFVWRVGERAASGEDIRAFVLGLDVR